MFVPTRAERQHILTTTNNGDGFTPSRSAAVPATVRAAVPQKKVGRAPINVAVRVPVAPTGLYDSNGKLSRAGKQDCRHNDCRGMSDLVDDNHSIPHSNLQ